IQTNKTGAKKAKIKTILVVTCLVMLLISIGAVINYWLTARFERRVDDAVTQKGSTDAARQKTLDKEADLLLALDKVGIDFSVQAADLKQWLNDKQYTPYPALAEALLLLLESKRLQKPVYLDVIVNNYELMPTVSSPRDVTDVDSDLLKAAVIKGHNTRYGEEVRDFENLTR